VNASSWTRPLAFTAGVALLAAVIALVAHGHFKWGPPETPKAQCEALNPATLMLRPPPYRTEVATAVIREPQNTWSNLAFVFVGALIWARQRHFLPRLLAVATIALGLASGLYHASLLPKWRMLDVVTMGWTAAALACVGFEALVLGAKPASRLRRTLPWLGLLTCGAATAVAVLRNDVRVAGFKPFDTTYTTIAGIAVVFVLLMLAIFRHRRSQPGRNLPLGHIAALAGSVGLAAFLQISDRPGHCCGAPDALVQGHAVWHTLMAAAVYIAFTLFESASVSSDSGTSQ
jgi:hypothetical protein